MGEKKMTLKRAAELCAQEFTVNFADGSAEKIWVRTPTQPEIQEADEPITEARLALREKYAPGTVFYRDFVASLELKNPFELAEFIADLELLDIQGVATKGLMQPIEPDWSKYGTEKEKDKARTEHAERIKAHNAEVETLTNKKMAERIEELAKQPKEKLIEQAAGPAIDNILRQETNQLAQDYMILASVRCADDREKPYFDSIDEVRNVPSTIKMQLQMAIHALGQITPVDIKNSSGKSVWLTGLAVNTQESTMDVSTADSQESDSARKSTRGGRKQL